VRILVTGASGLVGSFFVGLAGARHNVLGVDRSQLDITDKKAIESVFNSFSPAVVLHCAAYTDVDGSETNPQRAMKVNAIAPGWIAEAAQKEQARMIYISTDYVFDGASRTPYREEHVPAPLSIYGSSKLEGEHRIAKACPEGHTIVRTGWLYGPGSGFVDWALRRLQCGEVVPAVSNQVGSPTCVVDLVDALMGIVEGGHRGVFHVVNRGEVSWFSLAMAITEILKLDELSVSRISSESLERPAQRPSYSALSVEKYEQISGLSVNSWYDALKKYLVMQVKNERNLKE
jgi:dTDP-4-dehydrorhamnose reductase